MADDDAGATGGKTFTQAEVDAVVRDRLKREREKFADYDDLKSRADDADKNRGALEKLLDRFGKLEEKLGEADARELRREVAEAKGLTPAQAKRLSGKTRDELMADADDLVASFKPQDAAKSDDGKDGSGDGAGGKDGDASKNGATGSTGEAGKSADSGGKDGAKGDGKDGDGSKSTAKALPPSGRPTEKLTSGAVPGSTGDKSPAELAEDILKRPF